jgi:hypothetical protein
MRCAIVLILLLSSVARAELSKTMTVGFELGLSSDILLSDVEAGASGIGLGYQWGFTGVFEKNSAWPIKARLENIVLKESALVTSGTDSVITNTKLKSLEQRWWLISGGVEKRWSGDGRIWFWEGLLGYGFGQPSQLVLEYYSTNFQNQFLSANTTSGFIFSTGVGFRREVVKSASLVMNIRTMIPLFASMYATDPIGAKKYFVLPLMFTLGAEY